MHSLVALLCLLALAVATPVAAQTAIHHCIGANGGAVFTDQPCSALQATPVTAVAASPNTITGSANAPLTLCATNLGSLRRSVIDAFASRNANRLAGIMLWNGYGRGAAIADIRSLTQVMKQPLLDVSIPQDESPAPADSAASIADPFTLDIAPTPPKAAGNQLIVQTASTDGSASPHELRFDIVRQAGCLWLRNAD